MRPIARAIADKVKKAFIEPQLKLHLDFMEGELNKSTWFAGAEFSAADIQMSFPVEKQPLRVVACLKSAPSCGITCSAYMHARLISELWKKAVNTS